MHCTVVQTFRLGLALAAIASTLALAAPARAADTGMAGPTFGGASAPTGQKPQSKLWFNDGTWWGILYNSAVGRFEIFRDASGVWTPTGTVVDTRHNMYVDALWDGARLNVVSAGNATTLLGVEYTRYAYDAAARRYTRDVGPVALTDYGVEAAVLDRDGTGRLWATWTHDANPDPAALTVVDTQVEVAHSTTGDDAWTTPFVLPVANARAVTGDDISSVVRYAGHIGVLYSNQSDASFTFASHADGAADDQWSVTTALQGADLADDHINVKALEGDPAGQVFAAVKTSLNAASAPLVELLVLDDAGAWHSHTVFTVGDEPTRPQVALDPVRRQLHVFAGIGPCPPCTGGAIAVKTTSLDDPAFAPGGGTTLMASAANPDINNPTTTKQAVDRAMPFLPVLAGSDTTNRYWQSTLALPGGGPGAPPPAPPPASPPAPAPSAPPPTARPAPGAAPAPAAPARAPAAVLSRLRLVPAAFRARGTAVFVLSRDSRVNMRIERWNGRRWARVRTRPMLGVAGINRLAIRGRGRRPGRYRLFAWVPGRPPQVTVYRIRR